MKSRISTAALATILAAAMLAVVGTIAFGYNVRLSQIDPSRLLLTQNVRLYVSVTDDRVCPWRGWVQRASRSSNPRTDRSSGESKV